MISKMNVNTVQRSPLQKISYMHVVSCMPLLINLDLETPFPVTKFIWSYEQ